MSDVQLRLHRARLGLKTSNQIIAACSLSLSTSTRRVGTNTLTPLCSSGLNRRFDAAEEGEREDGGKKKIAPCVFMSCCLRTAGFPLLVLSQRAALEGRS